MVQLNHNIGSKGVARLVSYSATDHHRPRRGHAGPERPALQSIPSGLPALGQVRRPGRTPALLGRRGLEALWNGAPFRSSQDLYVLKDDYSAVFGKHLFKAGFLASTNAKNEDSNGNGSAQNSAFWGSAGLNGWGANTGNVLGDFRLKDMTWGFSEPFGFRQTQTRWKDLEFYVHDSFKVKPRLTLDIGARYSILGNYYSKDDTQTSFVPALYNPALGGDPTNGLVMVPGRIPARRRFQGGVEGPNRATGREIRRDRAAPGLRLRRLRERQDGDPAASALLPLRERQPRSRATRLRQADDFGIRKLDSNAEP
jgi:hypothetical protein